MSVFAAAFLGSFFVVSAAYVTSEWKKARCTNPNVWFHYWQAQGKPTTHIFSESNDYIIFQDHRCVNCGIVVNMCNYDSRSGD